MQVEQETWPSAAVGEEVMVVFRDLPLLDVRPYAHVTVLEGPVIYEVRAGTGPDTNDYTVYETTLLDMVGQQQVVRLPRSDIPEHTVTAIRVLQGRISVSAHSPLPMRMEFRSRKFQA